MAREMQIEAMRLEALDRRQIALDTQRQEELEEFRRKELEDQRRREARQVEEQMIVDEMKEVDRAGPPHSNPDHVCCILVK